MINSKGLKHFKGETLRFLPVLFLAVNVVFVFLYRRFLTGRGVYLYTDIGSDSITSSFPIIVYLRAHFRECLAGVFRFESGLGSDMAQIAVKYLNPLKSPLLLFSKEHLPAGLMLEQWILTNVCALSGFLFFRRLLAGGEDPGSSREAGTAACFASLMWTYSGFMTLWSQNLTTGVCIVMFTVFMAHLQHYLSEPGAGTALRMIPALALFLLTNYYYTWMTGVFTVLYLVFYAAFTGRGFLRFIKESAVTAACAVCGCMMAAAALVHEISVYTGSVRAGGAETTRLWATFGLKGIMTTVGRLFSVNMTGAGNSYSGAVNYYEEAALSVSIIALFAVVSLVMQKRYRLRTLFLTVFAALILVFKNSGAVLQLNANVQRYSFMGAFLLAIASGIFIRNILKGEISRKHLPVCAAVSWLLLAVLFGLLLMNEEAGRYSVNTRALKMVLLFAAGFGLIMVVSRMKIPGKYLAAAAFLGLCLEMVVMNQDTLYHRDYVPYGAYGEVVSGNGLDAAVNQILSSDDGVFRIGAARSDMDMNDGLLLDFPQTAVYSNSNPASLKELTDFFGTVQRSRNHFAADDRTYGEFELLAGRYLVRDNSGYLKDTPPEILFERAGETPDGSKTLYRNRYALPFGYLMREGESESAALTGTAGSGDRVTDLLPTIRDPYDVTIKSGGGNTWFVREGSDPYVYLDLPPEDQEREPVPAGDGSESVRILEVVFKPDSIQYLRSVQFYYLAEGQTDPLPEDYESFFLDPEKPVLRLVLPESVAALRFDLPSGGTGLAVTSINLIESSSFLQNVRELSKRTERVRDIRLDGNTWTARVLPGDEGKEILIVPFLYGNSWKASINGEEAVIRDSGGLCALDLAAGENEVTLTWETPFLFPARLLTGLSIGIWLLVALYIRRRTKRM